MACAVMLLTVPGIQYRYYPGTGRNRFRSLVAPASHLTIALTLGVVSAALAFLDYCLSGRLRNLLMTFCCFFASVSVKLFSLLAAYLQAKATLFEPELGDDERQTLIVMAVANSRLVAQLNQAKVSIQSRRRDAHNGDAELASVVATLSEENTANQHLCEAASGYFA